jgi:hypothetical protein
MDITTVSYQSVITFNGENLDAGSYNPFIYCSAVVKRVPVSDDNTTILRIGYTRSREEGSIDIHDVKWSVANELEIKAYDAGWRP